MSGAINKVKDALHLNKDHTTTTTTTHSTGAPTHSNTTGVPEGTAGPHSSRAANAADPRIDSDLDSSRHTGTTGGLTGTGNTHSHTTGTHVGSGGGVAGTSHTVGPHSSNLANKADPRVDSDLSNTTGHHAGATGTYSGSTGLSGTHVGNTSGNHTGTTGGISHSTNAGPHNSNLANKADPRVDSDLSGSGNRHGAATGAGAGILGASGSHATAGSGTAQNTAGPHNSDMANKLDPRVDADRDGSKTYGGNKTHA